MNTQRPIANHPASWKQLLWRRLRGLAVLALSLATIALEIYLLAPQWIVRVVEWRHASEAGLESQELSVDGQRWVYYEGGSGPTIMLLHGFDGSRDNWTRVARDLTGNFRVIIPDLPGWGKSKPVPGTDYGPRAQAERLASFIERVAPRNLVLVGHSMGGLIAGLYAAGHLDHVAAVGFVDSGGVGHLKPPLADGHNPFAYSDRAGFEQVLDLVFATPPQLPGRIEDVFVNRNAGRLDMIRHTFSAMLRDDASAGLSPVLPQLDKPALVMWCHGDKLVSSDAVDVFRKKLTASPRIDVTTLFGCSHMPMLEKPHATAQAITRFMLPPHPR